MTFNQINYFLNVAKHLSFTKAASSLFITQSTLSRSIASLEDAERFLSLGADRLGTSRVVRAVQELEAQKTAKEKSKT